MSQIFEKNIKALVEKNPVLASKLFGLKTHENFEVVQQGNDTINLNIIDKKRNYPIYETQPIEEITKKQKEIKEKYERYPVLYFYGIGNGIFTKLLFANPTHQKIYVFEPNLEVIYIALHIVDLSEEILHEKLEIYLPEEITFSKAYSIFSNFNYVLYSKLYELQIHSEYYSKFFKDDIVNLNKLFIRAIKQIIIGFGNDNIDTLIGIEHHIQNLPDMIKNYTFSQFANKKLSDTAVIVSTGPSLEKQLPLLKQIQNHVTIISVDASMPILEKWGIKPDFVTSLERLELTSEFFINTSPEFQKDIIKVHASVQHRKVIENSHGKKMIVMRPFRYCQFFKLHRYGYLGIGMSAANMAYDLAYLLNHKQIVLIGQDLAYSEDGLSHSKNHVLGEKEVQFSETDEYVIKYGGKGTIRTTKNWNMFRNYFERDIEVAKNEKGTLTINATEGGARIHGAVEMPFKEVIEKYVDKTKPKPKIHLRKPSQKSIKNNLKKAHKKASEMVRYGEKFQKEIEKVFLKIAKECELLEQLNKENRLDEIDYNKLMKLSKNIDKIKDKIETKKFALIFGENINSYLVSKELDLAKIMVKPANTELEKKAKLIDWIMNHKEWLFMLAGSINAQNIVIKRAIKPLENELESLGIDFEPLSESDNN